MLDVKPIEWILMNLNRFDQKDQRTASRPVLYYVLVPCAGSYLATSFLTLRFMNKGGSFSMKLIGRVFIPLVCSALVTDCSYSLNYSEFKEIYDEFRLKYEKIIDRE